MRDKQLYTWKNILNDDGSPYAEYLTTTEISEIEIATNVVIECLRESTQVTRSQYLKQFQNFENTI